MSVRLYMDHHIRSMVTGALRRRGVDVLTAEEDGSRRLADPDLLTRATQLDRVLFTQDADFLVEGAARLGRGEVFAGIIYVKQRRLSDRKIIDELEVIAMGSDPPEWVNRVMFLPL